jgi:hypothetical protein
LDSLADNGGPTKTHRLLSGSPAIDNGSNAIAEAIELEYDQRGEGFDRFLDGDDDEDAIVDIGAFEVAFEEL